MLIPLDNVDGKVWRWGFRGEILYIPIEDYSILPTDVEAIMVEKVMKLLEQGKKIAIFCIGGHGRTGYFTSLLLGKFGIDDPIGYMRTRYCKNVVETNSQVGAIADFINQPELKDKYKMYATEKWWSSYMYGNYSSAYYDDVDYCYECEHFVSYSSGGYYGDCFLTTKMCNKYDESCSSFKRRSK